MTDTNTQTQPQKSVMDCVKEYIAAHNEFTINDIAAAYPDRPKNQLSTALWKLRMKGKVARSADGKYSVLTGVNAPQPKAKVKAKRKVKTKAKTPRGPHTSSKQKTIDDLKARLEHANQEILHWNGMYTKTVGAYQAAAGANEQLAEALSIIRYLENKLYVIIQQAGQNGSNT